MTTSLCQADQSRLLLIDIQTRLAAAMADADRARVVRNSGLLLQSAALLDVPVYLSEQYPKGLGATEPALAAQLPATCQRLEKTRFCACSTDQDRGGFDFRAADEGQIIIAGMEAHVCVLQTAMNLHEQGLQVFVVADAVCSRDVANAANALDRLRQAGVIVTSTESVIFEWLGDAGHAQFKTLSALLR